MKISRLLVRVYVAFAKHCRKAACLNSKREFYVGTANFKLVSCSYEKDSRLRSQYVDVDNFIAGDSARGFISENQARVPSPVFSKEAGNQWKAIHDG